MNIATRNRTAARRARAIVPMAICLVVGVVIGWCLRAYGPPHPATGSVADTSSPATAPLSNAPASDRRPQSSSRAETPVATAGSPVVKAAPAGGEPGGAVDMLRQRHLRVPIDGADPETFKGGFYEHRAGEGGHTHEAVDILSPRNTPVHAVEDGTIAKIFESKAGGHTVYQFDPTQRFCYYYAHLERYADGLHDGQPVKAGDVIGYVGTSGNAPPGTPHLHFAVSELGADKRWWQAQPIDPYPIFRR